MRYTFSRCFLILVKSFISFWNFFSAEMRVLIVAFLGDGNLERVRGLTALVRDLSCTSHLGRFANKRAVWERTGSRRELDRRTEPRQLCCAVLMLDIPPFIIKAEGHSLVFWDGLCLSLITVSSSVSDSFSLSFTASSSTSKKSPTFSSFKSTFWTIGASLGLEMRF